MLQEKNKFLVSGVKLLIGHPPDITTQPPRDSGLEADRQTDRQAGVQTAEWVIRSSCGWGLRVKVGTHITAPCPTRESADCRCGLGSVTVRPHMSTAPCPSKFKLNISVTVRARCGHDGLVSVRTCVDLQVENCAAILSPYGGQHTAD
ncbi:hypothetical protein J6590_005213 [Homalodisca vitripennis]|nr:hypothetical protein J6590_005213 [Homalodisca vitripennis]